MPTPPVFPLSHHLCFALYSASLSMTKVYRPLLKKLGLTYPQYLVLVVLWERKQCTVSQLCEVLYLDSGTLSPLLKRLEASLLVTRERSASDERQVLIGLTARGRTFQNKCAVLPECIVSATGCSLDALNDLTGQLQVLRNRLQGSRAPLSKGRQ